MAKRRKIKKGRLALVIIGAVLGLAIIVFSVFGTAKLISNLLDKKNNNNVPTNHNNNNSNNNEPISTNKDIKITLDSYRVYEDDTDKLGFDFVIAQVTFESSDAISFDLNKLQTEEKINLGDVTTYLDKLSKNGININKLNITSNIFSDQTKYSCNIFVPYKTDTVSLKVYNLVDTSKIDFDLSKNTNKVTSLKLDKEDEIVIDDTYLTVSQSYESTNMLHNDEPYYYPDNIKIYTFDLYVNNVDPNTNQIISATFVPDNSSETYNAMKQGYCDISIDNIIGKTLNKGDKYALFFEVFSSDDVSYEGKLIIQFDNNDKLVEISTVLQ